MNTNTARELDAQLAHIQSFAPEDLANAARAALLSPDASARQYWQHIGVRYRAILAQATEHRARLRQYLEQPHLGWRPGAAPPLRAGQDTGPQHGTTPDPPTAGTAPDSPALRNNTVRALSCAHAHSTQQPRGSDPCTT